MPLFFGFFFLRAPGLFSAFFAGCSLHGLISFLFILSIFLGVSLTVLGHPMNNLKRRASRIGGFTQPVKVKFSILILTATVPVESREISLSSVLSICFERGGKISSTSPFSIDPSRAHGATQSSSNIITQVININEKVELMATLYRENKTGKYQEKTGKLYLRKVARKNIMGSDSFQGVAMCNLQLNQYAEELAYSTSSYTDVVLQLESLKGCCLHVIINSNLIKLEDEDSMSISSLFSDSSDMSTIGANFSLLPLQGGGGGGPLMTLASSSSEDITSDAAVASSGQKTRDGIMIENAVLLTYAADIYVLVILFACILTCSIDCCLLLLLLDLRDLLI